MPSWERFTWLDWDLFTWEDWGRFKLYEDEDFDRGPVVPTCAAAADGEILRDHTGWFWNVTSPVAPLYNALRVAVCSYTDKLLEDLCIATKAAVIRNAEFYYRRRRLLLLLDASKTSWQLAPWRIVEIARICNREDPSDDGAIILSPGEFTVARGELNFAHDIANDSRFTKVFDNGVTYVACWALEPVVVDYGLYHNFGAALTPSSVPSRATRDIVKRLWDGVIGGFSAWHYFAIDAAVRNLPLAEYDDERVLEIVDEDGISIIITDKDKYLLYGYTPSVEVGNILSAGQPLVAGHGYFDFRSGSVPDDVEYVIVPSESLQHVGAISYRATEGGGLRLLENGDLRLKEDDGFYSASSWLDPPGDLVLRNEFVPVTVNHSAKTVSWPVSEDPLFNAWFWNETRMRERKYGVLLYDLLVEKYGSIPSTINPLEFFAKHILRGGAFVITLPQMLLYGEPPHMLDRVTPSGIFVLYGVMRQGLSESASG